MKPASIDTAISTTIRQVVLLVSLIAVFSCQATAQSTDTSVSFGIVKSLSMPYANPHIQDGHYKIDDGLLVELSSALAPALGRTLVNRPIDREHVVALLLDGDIDIVCNTTPAWLGSPAGGIRWSEPILETRDILISKKGAAALSSLDDLVGKTLGTVAHYKYPLIESLFADNLVKRIPANNEQNNFIQLFRSADIDAIVFKEITFDYLYIKQYNQDRLPVFKHPLVIESQRPRCALSPHSDIELEAFNEALRSLKARRVIESYLATVMQRW